MFLGMIGVCRVFIEDFARLARPLHLQLKQKLGSTLKVMGLKVGSYRMIDYQYLRIG